VTKSLQFHTQSQSVLADACKKESLALHCCKVCMRFQRWRTRLVWDLKFVVSEFLRLMSGVCMLFCFVCRNLRLPSFRVEKEPQAAYWPVGFTKEKLGMQTCLLTWNRNILYPQTRFSTPYTRMHIYYYKYSVAGPSSLHVVPARPYESCKIFKGWPRRNAFSKLVHRQYKSFLPDRFLSGGNQEHKWVE